MKRLITIFFLLLFSYNNLSAVNNDEFRATWIKVSEHIKSNWTTEQNKAQVREVMDNHKKANMNAVLWQARQSGTAYYNSNYEPWGYYAGYAYPGYDPLAYAIEEAHKRGMELHAWFNVFHTSSTHPGTPAADHPEWVCTDEDGVFMTVDENGYSIRCLSPGLDAVREYLISVAMEIVRNYDIDGIHFDYVRWNEYTDHPSGEQTDLTLKQESIGDITMDGMITPEQIAKMHQNPSLRYIYDIEHPYSAGVPAGFSSWDEWRRWCVTEFVRVFNDSAKAVKSWVRVSVAALGRYNWGGWQGYDDVFQDAALWFNQGYIDQLTPMHYHWSTGSEFYGMLVGDSPACWFDYIQEGINAGRLFSTGPGSYKLAEDRVWYKHPDIVETVRTIPWVDGFQFFGYGSWDDYQYWEKAGSTFFSRKTKVRDTKLISNAIPDAPTIQLTKVDSLHYQITITHPPSIVVNHRFAIYRSMDNLIDIDSDEIVDIHFGKEGYSIIDSFNGLQDYNGTYFYAATTLDRYWNESDTSNVAESDPIPSYAPTVIATDPVEGDTISVNSPIVFYFSKTMDPATFTGAITFSPAIEIDQLIWNNEKRSLTVDVKGNFSYATDYTLTIERSVADINGKSIDGNADGIAGDPFYLHFRTFEVDNMGPIVVFSHPNLQVPPSSIDVEDVFTFIFDEIIDPETIYDSTFVLSDNTGPTKIDYIHSIISDKSIINLKPFESLLQKNDYSLLLCNTIRDTTGNQMDSNLSINFVTSVERYAEMKMIDDFNAGVHWWQPSQAGQFYGLIASGTAFEYTRFFYLPGSWTNAFNKRCSFLTYLWMETPPPEGYLLREYLNTGPPRDVIFDKTYTLQCYVYGDRSINKFRFCIDEGSGSNWTSHEVSKWITIDWYGWKLLEWNLSDPSTVGTWDVQGNNGILDGSTYRFDSFQLTHDNSGAISGKIYFDNLRLVKKTTLLIHVNDRVPPVASSFQLFQNYPNPFNPFTTISFNIPNRGRVVLKIYDILGRTVANLIDETLEPGHHEVQFDAAKLASGIYFYRLGFNNKFRNRQMLLIK